VGRRGQRNGGTGNGRDGGTKGGTERRRGGRGREVRGCGAAGGLDAARSVTVAPALRSTLVFRVGPGPASGLRLCPSREDWRCRAPDRSGRAGRGRGGGLLRWARLRVAGRGFFIYSASYNCRDQHEGEPPPTPSPQKARAS